MFFPIWRVSGRVFDTMEQASAYAFRLANNTEALIEVETRDAMQSKWRHYLNVQPATVTEKLRANQHVE